jgi:multiple antibiotic resistance protein
MEGFFSERICLAPTLQAIITVLSLVNPFMCASIFAQIEAGRPPGAQIGSAARVALANCGLEE